MKRKTSKLKIFKIICLIIYILCVAVLVAESCKDGNTSAAESNAVGGGLATLINGMSGDTTVAVAPDSLTIDNKEECMEIYVGDTFKLETTTSPDNATYKQVIYSSSDTDIATVTASGEIKFIRAGTVTITATNEKYNNVYDKVSFNVLNVEIKDIDIEILNAHLNNEVYTLYADEATNYQIATKIIPNNATLKNVEFTQSSETYFTVDEKGKIKNLKDSKGIVTTITVSSSDGKINKDIQVIVDLKNKVNLESITISTQNDKYEIYETETLKLNIKLTPSNSTNKSYTITSSNTDVISITNNTIKGLTPGTVTITVTPDASDVKESSIEITVLARPLITEFEASLPENMFENESKTISLSDIKPNKYALKSSLIFSSSNTDIATVDENGKVTAKKEGNVTITIKTADGLYSKTLQLNVEKYITDEENHILGFNENINFDPLIITENNFDLSSYFKISNSDWKYDSTGIKTGDKTLNYYFINQTNNVIDGSTLIINEPGEISFVMQHLASGQKIELSLLALNSYKAIDKDNKEIDKITIGSKTDYHFSIIQNDSLKAQTYDLSIIDTKGNIVKNDPIISIDNDGNYQLKSFYTVGDYVIKITPIYDNVLFEDYSKTIPISIFHNELKNVDFDVYINNNLIEIENTIKMYINEQCYFKEIIDLNVINYDLIYNTSNENIAYVNEYNKLIIKSVGDVEITLIDEVSKKSKIVKLEIYNQILIDQNDPIDITGSSVSFDSEQNKYKMTNGSSGEIKVNFLEASTYKDVTYISSDDNVLSVGKDGTLTPHKVGNVTITVICDDNMQEKKEIYVDIEVAYQPLITDFSGFFYKVRKALGHFGAFLVLGIFSTLTYMLFFTKKKWLFSVPLNFALGFFVAFLTEYIQTFVPGRTGSWNDIMIDFSGFLCSAVVLTISIFVIYFVKYIKEKLNKA